MHDDTSQKAWSVSRLALAGSKQLALLSQSLCRSPPHKGVNGAAGLHQLLMRLIPSLLVCKSEASVPAATSSPTKGRIAWCDRLERETNCRKVPPSTILLLEEKIMIKSSLQPNNMSLYLSPKQRKPCTKSVARNQTKSRPSVKLVLVDLLNLIV